MFTVYECPLHIETYAIYYLDSTSRPMLSLLFLLINIVSSSQLQLRYIAYVTLHKGLWSSLYIHCSYTTPDAVKTRLPYKVTIVNMPVLVNDNLPYKPCITYRMRQFTSVITLRFTEIYTTYCYNYL